MTVTEPPGSLSDQEWEDLAAGCDIVSLDSGRTSALIRRGGRGWQLRSAAPHLLLTRARQLAGAKPSTVPDGPAEPPSRPQIARHRLAPVDLFLDAAGDGWGLGRWESTDDLVAACRTAASAAVPVAACAARLGQWAGALVELSGATVHQPVLVLGRWLVVGPVVRTRTDHRWFWAVLDQLDPHLTVRVAQDHRLVQPPDGAPAAAVVSATVAAREIDPDGADVHLWDLRTGSRQRVRAPRSVLRWRQSGVAADTEVFQPWVDREEVDAAVPLAIALASASDPVRPVRAAAVSPLASLATVRATFEAAERFALNRRPARTVTCARDELPTGEPVVFPDPFTDEQLASPGFPFEAVDLSLPRQWTHATSLTDGQLCWVPTDLACLAPAVGAGRPCTARTSTGTAAHTSGLLAEQSGLLEVVERDLVVRHWFTGRVRRLDAAVWARELDQVARQFGREPYLYICDDPLVPVCVVTLHDPDTGAAHVAGCAAAPTVAQAATHAFEEALMLHQRGPQVDRPAPLAAPLAADPLDQAGAAAIEANFSFDQLRRRYRAVSVDLDTPGLRAEGIVVRRVISPIAVDLLPPNAPLAERLLDEEQRTALDGSRQLVRLFLPE
ncbi:YcaO-like family protein [Micromonospora sagamiensis]|uniref:Thiazole/oxazole-forming peptide maturase SagD family component n=1 Tax=Micromonospora sagamiensis TaxID=47875 RepID=A0A562WPE8_9ACTN|nr:YcaO-like family protein [Micromonospora sagamiensis]TWJ32210.1 thiazole/oxazole-forming peptide maturase SagD family component [Micromonospora sagamiensis]BCL14732.1 hypothetical protein GCM10017556_24710 [Micromonospora sagamiensis]